MPALCHRNGFSFSESLPGDVALFLFNIYYLKSNITKRETEEDLQPFGLLPKWPRWLRLGLAEGRNQELRPADPYGWQRSRLCTVTCCLPRPYWFPTILVASLTGGGLTPML